MGWVTFKPLQLAQDPKAVNMRGEIHGTPQSPSTYSTPPDHVFPYTTYDSRHVGGRPDSTCMCTPATPAVCSLPHASKIRSVPVDRGVSIHLFHMHTCIYHASPYFTLVLGPTLARREFGPFVHRQSVVKKQRTGSTCVSPPRSALTEINYLAPPVLKELTSSASQMLLSKEPAHDFGEVRS